MLTSIRGQKYYGEETLVIAIDLGTVDAAVAYTLLSDSNIPAVKIVTGWPGQPPRIPQVPSVLAYRKRQFLGAGAEALGLSECEHVRFFKLHLHPNKPTMLRSQTQAFSTAGQKRYRSNQDEGQAAEALPALPLGVDVKQCHSDFLCYLWGHTKRHIQTKIPGGHEIWERHGGKCSIVLTTPNGWGVQEHIVLRDAAVEAGLVSAEDVHHRLNFLTEAEASVHSIKATSSNQKWLVPGITFAVIDAGGSSIDGTAYKCEAVNPTLKLTEMSERECVYTGGYWVDRKAEEVLQKKMNEQQVDLDALEDVMKFYTSEIKETFDGTQEYSIPIRGMQRIKLFLTSKDICEMFEEVKEEMIDSLIHLFSATHPQYILLSGGLCRSTWIQKCLMDLKALVGPGDKVVEFVAEELLMWKAAADGAAWWFVEKAVQTRVVTSTIGMAEDVPYNSTIASHRKQKKEGRLFECPNKGYALGGQWLPLLKKGERVHGNMIKRHNMTAFDARTPSEDSLMHQETLYVWNGDNDPPYCLGMDDKPIEGMRPLCVLHADLSAMKDTLIKRFKKKAWEIQYSIVMSYDTSLKAHIEWENDEGEVQTGPAQIIELPTNL